MNTNEFYDLVVAILMDAFNINAVNRGTAIFLADSIIEDVIEDVETSADEDYNDDDVRIAIKRVIAHRLHCDVY